jgi:predicted DNA-binding protein with PD1-like motif
MRSEELNLGRTFQLVFDHGDDLLPVLKDFCLEEGVRQAYIPMFVGGLAVTDIVGTCNPVDNVDAPVWDVTRLHNVEAFGGGTVVYDIDTDMLREHIHVTVGRKHQGAVGYTSHLKQATVQFTIEMTLVEVLAPRMTRVSASYMPDVPLLSW